MKIYTPTIQHVSTRAYPKMVSAEGEAITQKQAEQLAKEDFFQQYPTAEPTVGVKVATHTASKLCPFTKGKEVHSVLDAATGVTSSWVLNKPDEKRHNFECGGDEYAVLVSGFIKEERDCSEGWVTDEEVQGIILHNKTSNDQMVEIGKAILSGWRNEHSNHNWSLDRLSSYYIASKTASVPYILAILQMKNEVPIETVVSKRHMSTRLYRKCRIWLAEMWAQYGPVPLEWLIEIET